MTSLRRKMMEDLALRGLADSTRDQYVRHVRRFAEHYNERPDALDCTHIRGFLLHLHKLGQAPSTRRVAWAALRFLYVETLGRSEVFETIPAPRVPRPRPRPPLTLGEVRRLIDAAACSFDATFLRTLYAIGGRVTETCQLQADDVDSRARLIHLRRATKGGVVRCAMLGDRLLQQLRRHWKTEQLPGPWLFPAQNLRRPGVVDLHDRWADRPVSRGTMNDRFRALRERADLKRRVTLRDFRHAFASHLHASGYDIRTIQVLLGHASVETTTRYVTVSTDEIRQVPSPFELLDDA